MRRMFSKNQLENQTEELLGSGSVPSIKAGEIIENMSGYSFEMGETGTFEYDGVYAGVVKNGNKITFVFALNLTKPTGEADRLATLGAFSIPSDVGAKLYPSQIDQYSFLDNKVIPIFSNFTNYVQAPVYTGKNSNTLITMVIDTNNFVADTKYFVRYEVTFLLSDNLISQE